MLLLAVQQLKSSPDIAYEFIYCDGKPPAVMIARKVTPKHKEMLTDATGTKRFLHSGACRFQEGHLVFEPEKPASSLTPKLNECFQHHTGKKQPIRVAKETDAAAAKPEQATDGSPAAKDASGHAKNGHTAAEPSKSPRDVATKVAADAAAAAAAPGAATAAGKAEASGVVAIKGSVGKGGKNNAADVQAVQAALNKRAGTNLNVDGVCGAKTIEAILAFQKKIGMSPPDGLVEPGNRTEAALNGKTIPAAGKGAGKGATGSTSSGTAKGGASGAGGSSKASGNPILEAGKAAMDLVLKAAKEAEQRRKQIEQAYQDALKQILKALKQVAGVAGEEGKKIKEGLERAYKENLEHLKEIQKTASDLEQKKTQAELEALKKLVGAAEARVKAVVEQIEKASDWLKKYAGDVYKGAKDLAKEVAKKVAEGKKQADDAYNDLVTKLKKAAEAELGPEGKKIKEEIEKAYKENQEHLKVVAQAAKDLAVRETNEAAERLQKAADTTVQGFRAVQDLAQRGLDWWKSQ